MAKNDGGVEPVCSTGCLCICKATTRKAENSCIMCEAQAYRQQRANLPAVVQMIEAIYICACARHGVREIGAIYGNSVP